jgi:hypothetical protein
MKYTLMMIGLTAALICPPLTTNLYAQAQTQMDKGCWVEIYEDDNYDQDDPHVVIEGPAKFATMKNVGGKDWSNDIESLIVGPNATVKAYKERDFSGTEVSFTSNQRVSKLSKLDMGNDIESMIISCNGR